MEFEKKNLILVDVKYGKSKKGNKLIFVELHDPVTFKNERFLCSSIEDLPLKSKVNAILIANNGYFSVDVTRAQ